MSIAPDPTKLPPKRRQRNPYAAFAIRFLLLGAIVLVVVLAVQELRSRGTQPVGVSVANYRAIARADGRPAPGFTMPALDGDGTISLSTYEGRVVVLNFWASWCAPCRLEASGLERAWADFRGRGVQFLGINYRDDRAAARAFQEEFGITYPSVFDPGGTLAFDYELIGLPTTFIIGPDGRIIYRFTGYLSGTVLRSALADVLGGEVT